jgi:hypothetical protein
MGTVSCKRQGNLFRLWGHLSQPDSDELRRLLEAYLREVPAGERQIDLSSLHTMAPAPAKTFIECLMSMDAKEPKVKVRAPPLVVRVLQAFGGEKALQIEAIPRPVPFEEAQGNPLSVKIHFPSEPPSRVGIPTPKAPLSVSPAPPPKPIAAQGVIPESQGEPLVPPDVELPPGLGALKKLQKGVEYTFHFSSGSEYLIGRIIEWVSGAWIVVDCKGVNRLLNLDQVAFVDFMTRSVGPGH